MPRDPLSTAQHAPLTREEGYALIRGAPGVALTADPGPASGQELLRPAEQDLFR
jgi:hypothetical protein